jgi:hypothetical protein
VFGTLAKPMKTVQSQAKLNTQALNKIMIDRYTLTDQTSSASSAASDLQSRTKQFVNDYCNPADLGNGLALLCDLGDDIAAINRQSNDVKYPDLVLRPLTIDVNFETSLPMNNDIIALAKNLYWFDSFSVFPEGELEDRYPSYQDARNVMAMSSVAHNSFATLIGMKARGTTDAAFMKDYMQILLGEGSLITPDQVLGENPSYFAMMDVLTKKLYQDGSFFTNLYDKPANVARIKTSLQAIQLMHERDRYEASLRREMLSSMLLENSLLPEQERVEAQHSYLMGISGI